MRLTDIVYKTVPVKKFTNYRDLGYKYKVVRIPALKDEIRVRKEKAAVAPCVNEMSRMMDCWKRVDFNQSRCQAETEGFLACMAAAETSLKEEKERAAKGLPMKGSRLRPSRQVNEMLARYPQPKTNLKK